MIYGIAALAKPCRRWPPDPLFRTRALANITDALATAIVAHKSCTSGPPATEVLSKSGNGALETSSNASGPFAQGLLDVVVALTNKFWKRGGRLY
ncbi:hypothetical protein Trydic_g5017 [Trypoxylus dichotomus]